MKKLIILMLSMCLMVGCVLIPSKATETPTPVPISDADFAETARSVCDTLKEDRKNIKASLFEKYTLHGEAMQKAVDALQDIPLTEEYAPQASKLMQSMAELAQVLRAFAEALEEGVNKHGLVAADVSFLFIADDGRVWAYTEDSDYELEIDPELVLRIEALHEEINTAAEALSLDACKIE